MTETWCIFQEGIPIGFFQEKYQAQEALNEYLDSGIIKQR